MTGLTLSLVLALMAPDAAVVAPRAADPAPKPAEGPAPEVTYTCTPSPVRVGEPLVCTLSAVHPAGTSVAVPVPPGSVDQSGGEAGTTRRPDGRLETRRTFRRAPNFEVKDVRVPPLMLTWREPDGGEGHLEVPGPRVPVKRLVINLVDPQLRTFEAPGGDADAFWERHGPVPYLKTNKWAVGITIAAACIAVGLVFGWLLRRFMAGRERARAPWVDPRPAHVIALEALQRLAQEDLPGKGQTKQYYFRLSEIVRDYLERRFGFAALEMTSDEIRGSVKALSLSMQANLAVEDFLTETDLVKFADFNPSEGAIETAMRAACGIVELTRAPEEEEAVEAPA